jgi:phospho-N-acetylmuramoyl-pentapeptide-transferase
MLSDFLYGLKGLWSPLNVFHYITFRMALGAAVAFILCFTMMPAWIRWFQRRGMGQVIRKAGPRAHRKKSGTPTMGGVVVAGSITACILLFARPGNPLVWLSLFSLLWFGAIGFVDDWRKLSERRSRGLSAPVKMLWQFVGAVVLACAYLLSRPYGIEQGAVLSLPFIRNALVIPLVVYLFLAALVMVGTSNGVNLTDGLDGLAAGCVALAAVGLAVLAYVSGNKPIASYLRIMYVPNAGELAVVGAIVVGALMGFLWYNAYPAEVFMGDLGALGLGGMLGAIAVFIKAEVPLAIFGGVFVLESVSVLAQVGVYKLIRRRIFLMAPLHHHFELSGVHEAKVIVRFWIFGVLLIVAMLSMLKLR